MVYNTSPDPRESSILTPQEKYNRIRNHSSFSFSRSRLGGRYLAKIMVLVASALLLTWYGNQRSNNPFSRSSQLIVTGSNRGISLIYTQSQGTDTAITVILPTDTPACSPAFFIPTGNWNLISHSDFVFFNCYTHKPTYWSHIKPFCTDTAIPHLPGQTEKPVLPEELEISLVHPFGDKQQALLLQRQKAKTLCIDASLFTPDQAHHASLHEQLELLIAFHATETTAIQLRSLFRPRSMVVFYTNSTDTIAFPNMFVTQASQISQYTFAYGSQGSLKLGHFTTK